MIQLSKFAGPVLAECPGAPLPQVYQMLRRSAQDVCTRVPVWVQTLPSLTLDAGQVLYDLTDYLDDPSAEVVAIAEKVRVVPCTSYTAQQGDPDITGPDPDHPEEYIPYVPESITFGEEYFVAPQPRSKIAEANEHWETEVGTEVRAMYMVGLNVMRLYPALTGDSARSLFYPRVQLRPGDEATLLPDEFMDSTARAALELGAVYRLQIQAGREWSNPLAGKIAKAQYTTTLADLHRRALLQGTGAELQVRMVPFGA